MKLGFFEIEPWEKKFFNSSLSKDNLVFTSSKLTLKNVKKYSYLEGISVFVHSEINKQILDQLPNLKLITTMSTGFDHIDLMECKKRKIKVCNVPTYGENTVAEHTFSLILSLSRKIIDCSNRTKKGCFDLSGLRGFDLKGKTIGIVGGGNIGKHVIRMANGFEMNILVFDLWKDQKLAKKMNFKYSSLENLFKNSDIITLHVPHNSHTHHLVNKSLFSLMKKTSYLVNTSRGEIVNTDDLVKALKSKKIAGAGLDVLEGENLLIEEAVLGRKIHMDSGARRIIDEDDDLLKMDNVIITPHNAFNTHEALQRILDTTVESIKGFKRKKYVNLVK